MKKFIILVAIIGLKSMSFAQQITPADLKKAKSDSKSQAPVERKSNAKKPVKTKKMQPVKAKSIYKSRQETK